MILPNIRKDILLSYITADYVNDIIETCIPICDSAGETVCKYLRKIVYDAYAQGFLSRNIKDELMNAKRKKPNIILLSKQELSLLLKEASKHPAFYFEILLALFVGLRSGEIMGLRVMETLRKRRIQSEFHASIQQITHLQKVMIIMS